MSVRLNQIAVTADSVHLPWFKRYADLFAKDLGELALRGFSLDEKLLNDSGRVVCHGKCSTDPSRRLRVEFPAAYPSFPPLIFDDDSQPILPRHHHATTRQLCLFGPASGRWYPKLTAADAIDEAEAVIAAAATCTGERNLKMDPPEPTSAQLKYTEGAVFLLPPPISEFKFEQVEEVWTFKFCTESPQTGRPQRAVITQVRGSGEGILAGNLYVHLAQDGEKEGIIAPLQKGSGEADMKAFVLDKLNRTERWRRRKENWVAFIYEEEQGTESTPRLAWAVASYNSAGELRLYRTFTYRESERQKRLPDIDGLCCKRVMLIGCGCLGSRMAVALAAAGVGGMELVDYDFYEPYNSVRHELGIESFGLLKAQALMGRVQLINPVLASVGAMRWWTAQIGSSMGIADEQKLIKAISKCDLVVDTTGVHHLSRWLNEQCHDLKTPSLYASVTNGAWSGEIVRVIPGVTGCWLCWMRQYYGQKPIGRPEANGGLFAPGCDQPTFTGTGYETGIVAHLATMVAVETLLANEERVLGFDSDYVRWRGRDANGAPTLSADLLNISPDSTCIVCGEQ